VDVRLAILVLVLALLELLAELLSELLELSEAELELVSDDDLALVVTLAEELTVDDALAVALDVAEETPEPPVTANRAVKFMSVPWLISSA